MGIFFLRNTELILVSLFLSEIFVRVDKPTIQRIQIQTDTIAFVPFWHFKPARPKLKWMASGNWRVHSKVAEVWQMAHFLVWRGWPWKISRWKGLQSFGSPSLNPSVWTTLRLSLFKGITKMWASGHTCLQRLLAYLSIAQCVCLGMWWLSFLQEMRSRPAEIFVQWPLNDWMLFATIILISIVLTR